MNESPSSRFAFGNLDRINSAAATAHEFLGSAGAESEFALPPGGRAIEPLPGIPIGWPRREAARKSKLSNGFVPRSKAVHRAYNFSVALLIVLAVLPIFAIIAVSLYASQGRPIFYRGVRLGEKGAAFNILKFRTLDGQRAAELTRDRVLPAGTGIETPLGRFLRETRLDELPQLLNVLRGDMNICGPRPVRPEIAAAYQLAIPGYSDRFRVKPGLIGPTQAYMSHGTSKAIRARFNYVLCRSPVTYRSEIGVILLVGACVLARTGSRLWRQLVRGADGTAPESQSGTAGVVVTYKPDGAEPRRVLAVNGSQLVIEGEAIDGSLLSGRLVLELPDGQRRFATIVMLPPDSPAPKGTVGYRYQPRTDFAEYILSRYLFEKVVVPHRSQFLGARLRRALGGKFSSRHEVPSERLEHLAG